MAAKIRYLRRRARELLFIISHPEANTALKEWMDFRSSHGEKITSDSWVIRDMWKTTNIIYGAK